MTVVSQEVKDIESPEKPFVFPDAIVQDEVIEVVDSSVEIKKNGKHQVHEIQEEPEEAVQGNQDNLDYAKWLDNLNETTFKEYQEWFN